MIEYNFIKNANLDKLTDEINQSGLIGLNHINSNGTNISIIFNSELNSSDVTILNSLVTNHVSFDQKKYIENIILKSINFGNQLISEFAAENVIMGITQDGMTGTVRKRMSEIVNALNTGSLYDAINEARAVPPEHKDSKYITDVRLLQFINKIEAYLGLPQSSSL